MRIQHLQSYAFLKPHSNGSVFPGYFFIFIKRFFIIKHIKSLYVYEYEKNSY